MKPLNKICLLGLLIFSVPILSDTSTGSIAALTSVSNSCQLTGGRIDFGAYDAVDANKLSPLDSMGTFSIKCTKGTTATLKIGSGQNSANAIGTTRAMKSVGGYLSYEIYTTASHVTVWNTVNTVDYVSASKNTVALENVWARVPAGQINVPGGFSYSDVVTITAEF